MRFKSYTQHLEVRREGCHTMHFGEYKSVREVQARLARANRWSVDRDTLLTCDGALVVHHHSWELFGVRVRSRIIEGFTNIVHASHDEIPDTRFFRKTIVPGLAGRREQQGKATRFKGVGRPLEGIFCKKYEASQRHITSCRKCLKQFIDHITDPYELRLIEEKRKAMEVMRVIRENQNSGAGVSKEHRKNEKRDKHDYSLAMLAD